MSREVVSDRIESQRPAPRVARRWIFLLLLFSVVILGLNWPIMVTGLRSVTPLWMAAYRVSTAAVVVAAVAYLSGNFIVPPRRDLPVIFSVAVFRLGTVMVLVFFGLRLVPAGRASVLAWTSAVWTVPIAATFLGEKMSSRKWVGLVIGLVGVVVLSEVWGNDWRQPSVVAGTGLLLIAALVNACTSVHIRRHKWTVNPLQALPWQLFCAACPLILLSFVVDGFPGIDWTPKLLWILAYQAVLASGAALWAQIVVLRNLSAVTTNLTMMGVPVVGVLSSVVALREPFTAALGAGMALVLAGVAINLVPVGTNAGSAPSETSDRPDLHGPYA